MKLRIRNLESNNELKETTQLDNLHIIDKLKYSCIDFEIIITILLLSGLAV